MKIDVMFLDVACSKPYNWETIEKDSLGGTECSTIRLAEGFASRGLKVCVVQRFDFIPSISPNGVIYAPKGWVNQVTPKNVIHIRFRGYIKHFTDAKQFIWFHDASYPHHNNTTGWDLEMITHNVQGVCVSDWHKQNLLALAPNMPLTRIYSPVDELCYNFERPEKVDVNQLVWMSSPHKGLKEAIEVFNRILERDGRFKLVVFNPGYYYENMLDNPSVVVAPKIKRSSLRSVLANSLCLFYPTRFEETFGLVASEANALGTPVASYGVAALSESSCDKPFKTEDELIEGILDWKTNRPLVTGQDRFRFDNIFMEWYKLFDLDKLSASTTPHVTIS